MPFIECKLIPNNIYIYIDETGKLWDPDFGALHHLELEEQVVQTSWRIKWATQSHHDRPDGHPPQVTQIKKAEGVDALNCWMLDMPLTSDIAVYFHTHTYIYIYAVCGVYRSAHLCSIQVFLPTINRTLFVQLPFLWMHVCTNYKTWLRPRDTAPLPRLNLHEVWQN